MRLLVVTNDYPPRPGGIQQYLGNLVDAYPGDVAVLAPADGPAETTRGESIVERDRRSWMVPTRRIARWVGDRARDHGAEAVLFGAPVPLPWLTGRLGLDVPVGVLCHGAEITLPAAIPGARSALRRVLRRADVVFAVSHFTERTVAALTGRHVTYVGGGVDVDAFSPRPVGGTRSESGGLVVGCVSRFVPRKGQGRLIAAVAELRSRGHDVRLVLVGRGRTEARLRARAKAASVPVRFEVDVPWSRLGDLYGKMDVFCMPCRSRWGGLEVEGLGLVFLEAAAAGLPVIAGTSGGAPETVAPGVTGYVADDVAGIVAAVERLAGDPQRRGEFGAAGRARVMAEFTWDLVVARLLAGFRAVA